MRGLSKGKHLRSLLILSSSKEHRLRRWLAVDLFVELIPINGIRNMGMIKKKKKETDYFFWGAGARHNQFLVCFHLPSKLVHVFNGESLCFCTP